MRLVILGEAEREFAESVAYYETKEAGLGWRFRAEVVEATGWIQRNPDLHRLRARGYRRRNLHAFPHYIAYVIREETIWIVAIAHVHRLPEFWLDRS
jgi:plasmid stabilization system protein ParE